MLSNLKRIEDTYWPTTVTGGSWRHKTMLFMPTVTKSIFKQNLVPTIAVLIVNAQKDCKKENKLHRIKKFWWFLSGWTLDREEFRREEIVPKASREKILVGISFVKLCLHLEDFHYYWRIWQSYWSVEVLQMVVTVVSWELLWRKIWHYWC